MAGHAEAATGDGDDAAFEEFLAEGEVVAAGGLGEEVEGSLGHGEADAGGGEHVGHGAAALGVRSEIDALIEEGEGEALAEDGGVDVAEGTVGEGDGGEEGVGTFEGGVDGDVADAFAGEGEALGEGAEDDGPGAEAEEGRDGGAVEGEDAVGLIGEEEEGRSRSALRVSTAAARRRRVASG